MVDDLYAEVNRVHEELEKARQALFDIVAYVHSTLHFPPPGSAPRHQGNGALTGGPADNHICGVRRTAADIAIAELQSTKLPPMRGRGEVLMQPIVHRHRPKWWVKEKRPDGTWTRTAIYGRPVKRAKSGKWVPA